MSAPGGDTCFEDDPRREWLCTSGGHNDLVLRDASGTVFPDVYIREFRSCYDQGQSIGPCAVVVNASRNDVDVGGILADPSGPYHGPYAREIGFRYGMDPRHPAPHGEVQHGGRLALDQRWNGNVSAQDAVILRP